MLEEYHQSQHRTGRGPQWDATPQPPYNMLYRVSLNRSDGSIELPAEDRKGKMTMRTNLWIHFVHQHARDTILILEEGNHPQPF